MKKLLYWTCIFAVGCSSAERHGTKSDSNESVYISEDERIPPPSNLGELFVIPMNIFPEYAASYVRRNSSDREKVGQYINRYLGDENIEVFTKLVVFEGMRAHSIADLVDQAQLLSMVEKEALSGRRTSWTRMRILDRAMKVGLDINSELLHRVSQTIISELRNNQVGPGNMFERLEAFQFLSKQGMFDSSIEKVREKDFGTLMGRNDIRATDLLAYYQAIRNTGGSIAGVMSGKLRNRFLALINDKSVSWYRKYDVLAYLENYGPSEFLTDDVRTAFSTASSYVIESQIFKFSQKQEVYTFVANFASARYLTTHMRLAMEKIVNTAVADMQFRDLDHRPLVRWAKGEAPLEVKSRRPAAEISGDIIVNLSTTKLTLPTGTLLNINSK